MDGLFELLNRSTQLADTGRDDFFELSNNHFSPGFWVAYVARARSRNLCLNDLAISNDKTLGYAKAIAIERALGEIDTYNYSRKRAGENYSPLVLLEGREQTDRAVSEINQCIRGLFGEAEYAEFVSSICELVGDLLDNVWAHGKSTGFSMAQKWSDTPGFRFEFAVADCGYGFLRELQRVGMQIADDRAAIEWCIQPGNSTKKRDANEWEQRLPEDVMGNPMGTFGRVVESDSHHMGLGLAKLVTAVDQFHGWCWLASGDAMLCISPDGKRTYANLSIPWKGVALACRFDSMRVAGATPQYTAGEFEDILAQLMRG